MCTLQVKRRQAQAAKAAKAAQAGGVEGAGGAGAAGGTGEGGGGGGGGAGGGEGQGGGDEGHRHGRELGPADLVNVYNRGSVANLREVLFPEAFLRRAVRSHAAKRRANDAGGKEPGLADAGRGGEAEVRAGMRDEESRVAEGASGGGTTAGGKAKGKKSKKA